MDSKHLEQSNGNPLYNGSIPKDRLNISSKKDEYLQNVRKSKRFVITNINLIIEGVKYYRREETIW